ncbi:MAG: hypothetical protein ACJ72E_13455 [Marmoricola sp.]
MEKLLARLVLTFTAGFLTIGVVLGLQKVGECGSVFDRADGCDAALAGHLSLVIAFLGLGLTGLVAAVIIDITRSGEKPADEDPAPHDEG